MAKSLSPIDIEIANESIRQQRETFDQRKQQDSNWFILQLAMGISAIIFLGAVLVFSIIIIANYDKYTPTIVTTACTAFFVDILGVLGAIWKIVLNTNPVTKLEPITKPSD